jgi:hypothetical protein
VQAGHDGHVTQTPFAPCTSQPGRLRYFLNRMPSHPSEQQPYKKNSYYYHPESCFLGKIFKKQMRKLLALKAFLIFEIFLNFLIFSVMREGSRLHAGEPPALHIASD